MEYPCLIFLSHCINFSIFNSLHHFLSIYSSYNYFPFQFISPFSLSLSAHTHPVYLRPDHAHKSWASVDSRRATSPAFVPCAQRSYPHSVGACHVPRCPRRAVCRDPRAGQTHRRLSYRHWDRRHRLLHHLRCHRWTSCCVLALAQPPVHRCPDSIDPPVLPCGTDASALCPQYGNPVPISSRSSVGNCPTCRGTCNGTPCCSRRPARGVKKEKKKIFS